MEIRTLRYFLEAAREENMSKAAERMHISQSALSKQLKGLEEELGKKLFVRHSFSIELTEEGMLLRKRAEDLLSMADKITAEFASMDDIIGGNIYFGCAESYQIQPPTVRFRHFNNIVFCIIRALHQHGKIQKPFIQLFRYLLRITAGNVVMKPRVLLFKTLY